MLIKQYTAAVFLFISLSGLTAKAAGGGATECDRVLSELAPRDRVARVHRDYVPGSLDWKATHDLITMETVTSNSNIRNAIKNYIDFLALTEGQPVVSPPAFLRELKGSPARIASLGNFYAQAIDVSRTDATLDRAAVYLKTFESFVQSTHRESVTLDVQARDPEIEDVLSAVRKQVVGQDEAVGAIGDVLLRYKAGSTRSGRPLGVLLFMGPSGVGKSSVVKAFSQVLFGDSRANVMVDGGQFQQAHEIAKLVGAPPGYKGHSETHPLFNQEAISKWEEHSNFKINFVLVDEIEKADGALPDLLLNAFADGRLTSGDNHEVDFSHTIFIITSNLGARRIAEIEGGPGIGFTGNVDQSSEPEKSQEAKRAAAVREAKRHFRPEFLGRVEKLVVFNSLQETQLREVVQIELQKLQERFLNFDTPFVFNLSDDLRNQILREGVDRTYNARFLQQTIVRLVEEPLSRLLATGQIETGDMVKLDYSNGQVTSMKLNQEAFAPRP